MRSYDVTAVLANEALGNPLGVTIVPNDDSASQHVGGALDPNGGTLVYNPRPTALLDPAGSSRPRPGRCTTQRASFTCGTADLDTNGKLKGRGPHRAGGPARGGRGLH